MTILRTLVAASIAGVFASTASAHGDVKCQASPKAEWKGQMELQKKLEGEGWRVRKVQVENGCYEVYGFDGKGERQEAFFDPKSFERVMPAAEAPAAK